MPKKNNKVWVGETTYITAGETIATCVINKSRVVYIHYKNGYYSLIEGLQNLLNFLNGDTSERFACVENYNDVLVEFDKI